MKTNKTDNKQITELKINRRKWGTGDEGGSLLNPVTGKMCCLGFFCLAAGVPKAELEGEPMPAGIKDCLEYPKLKTVVNFQKRVNKFVTTQLSTVNDSEAPKFVNNPKAREARIAKLFGELGVTVEFTGKYSKPQ